MVPTSSTSITLLLGDCIATTVMHKRNFSKEKFKVYHPGGNIGGSLLLAKDIMVTGNKLPIVDYKKTIKEALTIINKKKLGVVVVLKKSFVTGLISDGDLRREMRYDAKKITLEKIMTKNPLTVNENMPASKL